MELAGLPIWMVWGGTLVIGLLVGSFLNVIILRLPVMLEARWQHDAAETLAQSPSPPRQARFDLAFPGSRCPHCETPIKPWHNLPLIGYLLLRGKCADCGTPISIQYPIIEILSALLALIAVVQFGPTPWAGCVSVASWALLVLATIDLRTRLLPDVITLSLLWGGLVISAMHLSPHAPPPADAIIGAASGYCILWAIFQAFRLATGKIGMGYGDFKLTAALGAWVGWSQLPLILLIAALGGAILGSLLMASRRISRGTALPFGPWLALGGWLSLIAGDTIMHAYLTLSGLS